MAMAISPQCGGACFLWRVVISHLPQRESLPYFLAPKLLFSLSRRYLQDADTDENQGSLAFEEFCTFYKMISTRRDLYLIMISYSNQKEVMDLHDLARFLENEQKVLQKKKKKCSYQTVVEVLMWQQSVTFTKNIYFAGR